MLKPLLKSILSLALVVSFTTTALAQSAPSGGEQKTSVGGPRKHIATIIFAALGGAVLGLSTLSFYGRPQENLRNIGYGAAFGAIAATAYVTYTAATRPADFYGGDRPHIDVLEEARVNRQIPPQAQQALPIGYKTVFTF